MLGPSLFYAFTGCDAMSSVCENSKVSFWNSLNIQTNNEETVRVYIYIFFPIWVLFNEHSRFTGQQGKGEAISLIPLDHFYPLHRHLDISKTITADTSSLYIVSSRIRTGNLWFPSASR